VIEPASEPVKVQGQALRVLRTLALCQNLPLLRLGFGGCTEEKGFSALVLRFFESGID